MNQIIFLATVLATTSAWPQEPAQPALDISKEPHHRLILQNSSVRVFRLKLDPNEVTVPHRHSNFYAFVSLQPASISNEVRGRQPVSTHLEAGEIRTSRGSFTLAERNISSVPVELIIVEALKSDALGFNVPMVFRFHDGAQGELFESSAVRAYDMVMAVGGRTEKHKESYDRLLIALSDIDLGEETEGQAPSETKMRAGEVLWIPRGLTHTTKNVGQTAAHFIVLEFN
jgi:quercetin dioxygenase-like cupin family protein